MKITAEHVKEFLVYGTGKGNTRPSKDWIADELNKIAEMPEPPKTKRITIDVTDQQEKEILLKLKLDKWIRENDNNVNKKDYLYFITINYEEKRIYVSYQGDRLSKLGKNFCSHLKEFGSIYFSSLEKARACIDELGYEIKKVLGV